MIKADFTAELYAYGSQVVVVENLPGENPATWADEDGWLCLEAHRDKHSRNGIERISFDFKYIKSEEGRVLYYISCNNSWKYAGARLEQNPRGWLGLYGTGVIGRVTDVVTNLPLHLVGLGDYWKLETLRPWDGDVQSAHTIPFFLRDKHGHRVASTRPADAPLDLSLTHDKYLNASGTPGEVLTFNLRNIQLA